MARNDKRVVWALRESGIRSVVESMGVDLTDGEFARVCRDIDFPEWVEEVASTINYVIASRKEKA